MQSTVTFIGFTVASIVLGIIPFLGLIFVGLISVVSIITWIVCMVQA